MLDKTKKTNNVRQKTKAVSEGYTFEEKVVKISRVTKVTKGGARFSFSAVVVIGNKEGLAGYGLGKANEVSKAIARGVVNAKKKLINVKILRETIPHSVVGKYGGCSVVMKSASQGTGVVAGSAVRSSLEVAGVQNVLSKIIGAKNPLNVVRAVFDGFSQLRDPLEIARVRRVSLDKVFNG